MKIAVAGPVTAYFHEARVHCGGPLEIPPRLVTLSYRERVAGWSTENRKESDYLEADGGFAGEGLGHD